MRRPNIDDVITVDHRGQEVTGRVTSMSIDGEKITVHLALINPYVVYGPTNKPYTDIYVQSELES